MAERKRRYRVRYWNPNGNNIFLQKVFRPWISYVLPILWPITGKWENWLLLNNESYILQHKIAKAVKDIRKWYAEDQEVQAKLRRDKKDINNSLDSTAGTSEPFFTEFTDKEIKDYSVFLDPPDGDWRSYLNMKKFPNLKGKQDDDFREEMGVGQNPSRHTTAHIPKDILGNLDRVIEDGDPHIKAVVPYTEPQQQRKKRRRNNNNNQNQQKNNQDDYDDDYDDND